MQRHSQPTLLVADDDPQVLELIRRFAVGEGFEVFSCKGGSEALHRIRDRHADLALIDLRMPDVGGLDVISRVREVDPHCHIILMSGHATIQTAVEAVKRGAIDCLPKPLDFARLRQAFASAREEAERRRSLLAVEGDVARQLEFCGMIGRAPAMQDLFALIRRLAPHVRTALISGETGTGKELVARALHQLGPRSARRFAPINCSAVVESLFESELFGHVRGAFTGANEAKPGLFEAADGGTIFLDEVGELPSAVQAKLLRVIETGEVQRVGSLEPRRVDVRIIAATNRNLAAEAASGRFRTDLFYRLNVVEIFLPALRDRREDIPYLTAAFVREFSEKFGKGVEGLTPTAERLLVGASWPGNVRELRNVLERACMLVDGEFITERELSGSFWAAAPGALGAASGVAKPDVDRESILSALERAGGNKAVAARMVGLSRRAFYRRLEQFGLHDLISRDEAASTDEF
jgi:two-component system, NtrC family, response regulator HydG